MLNANHYKTKNDRIKQVIPNCTHKDFKPSSIPVYYYHTYRPQSSLHKRGLIFSKKMYPMIVMRSVITIFRMNSNITIIGYLSAKAKSLTIVEPVIQEAVFDRIAPTIKDIYNGHNPSENIILINNVTPICIVPKQTNFNHKKDSK